MAHGGKRPGAGRPPLAKNVVDREARERAHASGQSPLDFMLEVMRDESGDRGQRLDAAKAAAPYMHARLSAVELSGGIAVDHDNFVNGLDG